MGVTRSKIAGSIGGKQGIDKATSVT